MEPSLRLRNGTSLSPTPEAPSSHSQPLPAMSQGEPSWLLTARVGFLCLWTSCERNHPACALFCMASFTNIMFLRFIHIVVCGCSSFSLVLIEHSIVWGDHNLFIHSPVDGHLGGFQFGAPTNSSCRNVGAWVSLLVELAHVFFLSVNQISRSWHSWHTGLDDSLWWGLSWASEDA